jgi:hypothetical protein
MSKEQQELLDEVYKKYQSQTMFRTDDLVSLEELDGMCLGTGEIKKVYRQYAPKEFINKCKTDTEFSETWGLKIEERELSKDERIDLYCKEYTGGVKGKYEPPFDDFIDSKLTTRNIPTKLITITYNDKTLESYE